MIEQLYKIWSIEHNAWWKANHNGYTPRREDAGVYNYQEVKKILDSANIHLNDTPNEAMIPITESEIIQ